MKDYSPPQLTDYGPIAEVTAVFGSSFTGDILVDVNGDIEQEGAGSGDACPTLDFEVCHINP